MAFIASAITACWPGPTARGGSRYVVVSPPPIIRSSRRYAHATPHPPPQRRSSHAPIAAGSFAASAPFRPRRPARSIATRHEPDHRLYPEGAPNSSPFCSSHHVPTERRLAPHARQSSSSRRRSHDRQPRIPPVSIASRQPAKFSSPPTSAAAPAAALRQSATRRAFPIAANDPRLRSIRLM